MFHRMFLAALVAGVVAALFVTALQATKLTPLIAAAEVYEAAGDAGHDGDHGASEWEPARGLERTAYTLLANAVIAIGFGLLLSAGFALRGIATGAETDARQGLLWGLAGFACFSLAPALGLPPELPGTASAGRGVRQAWWLGTALSTALGSGLLVFARQTAWRVLGAVVIALPHLLGAPQPPAEPAGGVPAALAADFVAASLAIAALFWIVLGSLGGWVYAHLGRRG